MKSLRAFVVALVMLAGGFADAQSPEEQYVGIFTTIQQADELLASGQAQTASARYLEAQAALRRLQTVYPDWNPSIVKFRIEYVAAKVGATAKLPAAPELEAPAAKPAPVVKPAVEPSPELLDELKSLREQVGQLQADKSLLEAKLKEALTVQPPALDPRELAKAEERIRALEKETDLLKVTLEQERAKKPGGTADTAALRAENELLKKQAAEAKAKGNKGDAERDLQQARAQIAALQSDLELMRAEKAALENRVKTLSPGTTAATAPASSPTGADQLKQLQQERDELQRKLDAALREVVRGKTDGAAGRAQEMASQLVALRARIEVLEAHPVPYSAEELALMKTPEPRLATAAAADAKKPAKASPGTSATLIAEAQRQFAAKQYDKAEESYLQIVRQDDQDVTALANLAVVQMSLNRLDEAEKHARQAVAVAPASAHGQSVLGQVNMRQGKYDEAVDALSRAAQLNPKSAEVQNFLGVALSHKGLRVPAETALRKAIQLDPAHGGAHNNLAVIYLNQTPPMVELARWHYKKALAAGSPKNLELEKALEAKGTTSTRP